MTIELTSPGLRAAAYVLDRTAINEQRIGTEPAQAKLPKTDKQAVSLIADVLTSLRTLLHGSAAAQTTASFHVETLWAAALQSYPVLEPLDSSRHDIIAQALKNDPNFAYNAKGFRLADYTFSSEDMRGLNLSALGQWATGPTASGIATRNQQLAVLTRLANRHKGEVSLNALYTPKASDQIPEEILDTSDPGSQISQSILDKLHRCGVLQDGILSLTQLAQHVSMDFGREAGTRASPKLSTLAANELALIAQKDDDEWWSQLSSMVLALTLTYEERDLIRAAKCVGYAIRGLTPSKAIKRFTTLLDAANTDPNAPSLASQIVWRLVLAGHLADVHELDDLNMGAEIRPHVLVVCFEKAAEIDVRMRTAKHQNQHQMNRIVSIAQRHPCIEQFNNLGRMEGRAARSAFVNATRDTMYALAQLCSGYGVIDAVAEIEPVFNGSSRARDTAVFEELRAINDEAVTAARNVYINAHLKPTAEDTAMVNNITTIYHHMQDNAEAADTVDVSLMTALTQDRHFIASHVSRQLGQKIDAAMLRAADSLWVSGEAERECSIADDITAAVTTAVNELTGA